MSSYKVLGVRASVEDALSPSMEDGVSPSMDRGSDFFSGAGSLLPCPLQRPPPAGDKPPGQESGTLPSPKGGAAAKATENRE